MNTNTLTRSWTSLGWQKRPADEPDAQLSLLRQQAENWAACEFSPDLLLRGIALEQAKQWARQHEDDVTDVERDLIEDSESARRERKRRERIRGGVGLAAIVAAMLCAATVHLFSQARAESGRTEVAREQAVDMFQRAEQVRADAEAVATSALDDSRAAQQELKAVEEEKALFEDEVWVLRQRELMAWSQAFGDSDPALSILLALEAADIGHRGRLPAASRRRGLDELVEAMGRSGVPIAVDPSNALPRAGFRTAAWHAGYLLVARPEGGAILWDLAQGSSLPRIPSGVGPLADLRWSPDGEAIFLTTDDGRTIVWDPLLGKELGKSAPVPAVAPSAVPLDPDDTESELAIGLSTGGQAGAVYAGASDDPTLHVGDWPTLRAICCARAGRNMNLDEWNAYIGIESSYMRTCPEFPGASQ